MKQLMIFLIGLVLLSIGAFAFESSNEEVVVVYLKDSSSYGFHKKFDSDKKFGKYGYKNRQYSKQNGDWHKSGKNFRHFGYRHFFIFKFLIIGIFVLLILLLLKKRR